MDKLLMAAACSWYTAVSARLHAGGRQTQHWARVASVRINVEWKNKVGGVELPTSSSSKGPQQGAIVKGCQGETIPNPQPVDGGSMQLVHCSKSTDGAWWCSNAGAGGHICRAEKNVAR